MQIKLTIRMTNDLGDLRLSSCSNLTVQPLNQVETTGPEFPSPTLIPNAVIPEWFACERREWIYAVSHEAASGVGIHGEEEWDEEVMCVPEGLERLLTDAGVRSGVHEEHTQEHDMAGDATSLGIVDLYRKLWSNLRFLNIEEATKVSKSLLF